MTNVGIRKAFKALGVVAVLGVGFTAAGISSWASQAANGDSNMTQHDVISPDAAAKVLLSEEAAFEQPLPAGISWPKLLPANLLEKGITMEPLVPRGVVAFYWRCAWEAEYVDSADSGRTSEASNDLDVVAKFTTLPFYAKQFDDPGELWYADVIQATEDGDDTDLRNELSHCTYFFENQK